MPSVTKTKTVEKGKGEGLFMGPECHLMSGWLVVRVLQYRVLELSGQWAFSGASYLSHFEFKCIFSKPPAFSFLCMNRKICTCTCFSRMTQKSLESQCFPMAGARVLSLVAKSFG